MTARNYYTEKISLRLIRSLELIFCYVERDSWDFKLEFLVEPKKMK